MTTPPVLLISLSTCGYCEQAKAYFRTRGIVPTIIEFDSVGVDLRRQIAADMRAAGAQGFPFVKIGGRGVTGFDPAVYDRLLGMN